MHLHAPKANPHKTHEFSLLDGKTQKKFEKAFWLVRWHDISRTLANTYTNPHAHFKAPYQS